MVHLVSGSEWPSFVISTLDGRTVRISSQIRFVQQRHMRVYSLELSALFTEQKIHLQIVVTQHKMCPSFNWDEAISCVCSWACLSPK